MVDNLDADFVVRSRSEGANWNQIAEAHSLVKSASGRKVMPGVGSIRRAYSKATSAGDDNGFCGIRPGIGFEKLLSRQNSRIYS